MIVLLAFVLVQGAGLIFLWKQGQRSAEQPAAPSVTRVTQAVAPPPLDVPGSAVSVPGYVPDLPNAATAAPRPDAQRAARMRRLQQRLRELTANGRKPTPMELDPILQELTEIQGSTRIAGMDIQVLRDNLKVADRIQKLAQELEAEARKPQALRDNAKIQRLQAAILQEQRALRMDFMAENANNAVRRQAGQ
ncbi:MAG: hypothetical protein LBO00_00585 [Zoogloeaceae bacterium]|jgi:hypothetical protein|nr:hypothetical protein [Zoogloeaceae bacterium]